RRRRGPRAGWEARTPPARPPRSRPGAVPRVRLADRQPELAEPGRLVPVAALELDLPLHHMEEARSAERENAAIGRLPTERSSPRAPSRPFQGDPLPVLAEALDLAEAVGK